MEENKVMEEERMDGNESIKEDERKEEKNLGIEIRMYVNQLMSIQKKYEKAEMMLKVAKKSTVCLVDDENNPWEIKEILGIDYKTVEGVVQNLLWTTMNECEKEFRRLKGECVPDDKEKSGTEIEQEETKIEVKEEKEEVKGKEREEKKVKKETEKKKPIDKGKVITLHNAKWTNAKIADEMGISEGRVSQILKEARERMK